MFEQRLIERVVAGRADAGAAARALDTSAVLADVLAHLRELFSARQGSVPTRPDYGMPDINDLMHQFPNALTVLRRAITEQIAKFEPRLRGATVRHEPDLDNPLRLVFVVSAELVLEQRIERVLFHTAVRDDGIVSLQA